MLKLFFLFISLLLKYIKLETSFIIPFSNKNSMAIDSMFHQIDNPKKTSKVFFLPIYINEYASWIVKNNLEHAYKYIKDTVPVSGTLEKSLVSGKKGKIIISLSKDNIKWENFPFIFIERIKNGDNITISICLGLRKDGNALKYLYDKYKIINFAIDLQNHKVFFGGEYIQSLLSKKDKISICKIEDKIPDPNNAYWRCKLDYIIFNKKVEYIINERGDLVKRVYKDENVVYHNKFNTKFETKNSFIKAPKEFLTFIKDNYLPKKNCNYDNFYFTKFFVCSPIDKSNFVPITFVFNDYDFTFDFDDLFTIYETLYVLQITENNDGNLFELGSIFFQKYLGIFDIKEDNIKFYSNYRAKKVQILDHRNPNMNKLNSYLLFLNMLICGISLGVLFIVKKNNHIDINSKI